MMVLSVREKDFIEKRSVAECSDDAIDPCVRFLREMPIDESMEHVSTLFHDLHQKCPVIRKVDFVKADDGQCGLSQLQSKLSSECQLLLIELVVLKEQSDLHDNLDQVLDDLVRLLCFEFLSQNGVENVKEPPEVIVDERLCHRFGGELTHHFLLNSKTNTL